MIGSRSHPRDRAGLGLALAGSLAAATGALRTHDAGWWAAAAAFALTAVFFGTGGVKAGPDIVIPGVFRAATPGRRTEMSGPMTCGRRYDGLPVDSWHVSPVHEDFWHTGGGLVTQGAIGRSCSYCGSLHPYALMEKLRAGWTLEGSDKPYKWYLRDLNGRTVAKFYTHHLPRRAAEELLRGLGDGSIRHSLYVRPWLPSLADSAPAWLIGPVR